MTLLLFIRRGFNDSMGEYKNYNDCMGVDHLYDEFVGDRIVIKFKEDKSIAWPKSQVIKMEMIP